MENITVDIVPDAVYDAEFQLDDHSVVLRNIEDDQYHVVTYIYFVAMVRTYFSSAKASQIIDRLVSFSKLRMCFMKRIAAVPTFRVDTTDDFLRNRLNSERIEQEMHIDPTWLIFSDELTEPMGSFSRG